LGGFVLIEARDLNEAIQLPSKDPSGFLGMHRGPAAQRAENRGYAGSERRKGAMTARIVPQPEWLTRIPDHLPGSINVCTPNRTDRTGA
jgi:hypothetical protein